MATHPMTSSRIVMAQMIDNRDAEIERLRAALSLAERDVEAEIARADEAEATLTEMQQAHHRQVIRGDRLQARLDAALAEVEDG